MSVIHRMRNYLLEEEFEVKIYKGNVNVVNFTELGHFDSNKVNIKGEGIRVSIEGNDLVVSKLLKDEILVTGKINKIEFRWFNNEF